jgi:uncharacterized protein (DUF924 family)
MANEQGWVRAVLDYWFGALEAAAWFRKNAAVDSDIRTRFADVHRGLAAGGSLAADATAEEALATVIVLDQFPRNMYRDSPRMFASDASALAISQEAIARGLDRDLTPTQKQFLYMPFQHSEDKAVQARSVALFAALGNADNLKYAERHKEIVDRFGRFPHRNAILGRSSTPEELAFLKEPNSSF